MENSTKNNPAKNVEEYLHALPAAVRTALEKVRQSIKSAAPQAEEVIRYQIPTYKYKGPLIHFAAMKNHCSLIVVSKSIMEIFKKELQLYKTSGMTIHFTPEKPLPGALIEKIVAVRIKENEEKNAAKKTASQSKKI